MNMMMEVDILFIKQIELKYLAKIKKLFYLLAQNVSKTPNVSKLATQVDTSRATVMNYIKCLADARLINIIYPIGEDFPKKPSKIMLHNSSLIYPIYPNDAKDQVVWETFFVNSLWKDHIVNNGEQSNSFLVDEKLTFKICSDVNHHKFHRENTIYAVRNQSIGKHNVMPLWILGFLY